MRESLRRGVLCNAILEIQMKKILNMDSFFRETKMLRIGSDAAFASHIKIQKRVLAIFMDGASELEVRRSTCE